MVFTSPNFVIFVAVVLFSLWLLRRLRHKKVFLAIASCVFYAAWDWRYLGLLLLVSIIDYLAAARISGGRTSLQRRTWLVLSLISNLGILAYFKYCNFFLENLNGLLTLFGISLHPLEILLPPGISFYTFKTMSYTIDVYRKEIPRCGSWLDYTTFVTFFPELIAGPIVRASVFLPQLSRQIGPTKERLKVGSVIFLQGLTKKLLLGDSFATIADPIFADPAAYSSLTVWIGVLSYAMQIYFDFSGYSDMAIGLAKMIGYDLPENFRLPYLSSNIGEFWRRWHITLSSWLRDYLYIPLGGNRMGDLLTYRNLMITMLLGGLWHGASWNFVIWGGLHGLALVIYRLWSESRFIRLPTVVSWFLTFAFVTLAWIPFRADSLSVTRTIFEKLLFSPDPSGARWVPTVFLIFVPIVVLGHLLSANDRRPHSFWYSLLVRLGFCPISHAVSGSYWYPARTNTATVYVLSTWLLLLYLFAPTRTNPFIYFQF